MSDKQDKFEPSMNEVLFGVTQKILRRNFINEGKKIVDREYKRYINDDEELVTMWDIVMFTKIQHNLLEEHLRYILRGSNEVKTSEECVDSATTVFQKIIDGYYQNKDRGVHNNEVDDLLLEYAEACIRVIKDYQQKNL